MVKRRSRQARVLGSSPENSMWPALSLTLESFRCFPGPTASLSLGGEPEPPDLPPFPHFIPPQGLELQETL